MTMESLPQSHPLRRLAMEAVQRRPLRLQGEIDKPAARDVLIGFAYLRVSTKEQARTGGGAEGYSIPAQRVACLAKANQLGAIIEREYVDAGESARSADRAQLQQMLKDVKEFKPDFVIVHKIDRLARNREDDIAINLLLRKHGVKLISCTENVDDTPSGKLLYGLMAEIAQFYSGNLAQEVMKGLIRKAEEGGTPFRTPIGYLNIRELVGGVNAATVILDPERADLVRWCIEQYATGEWSAADLVLAAREKGLTTKPTRSKPPGEISLTGMYYLLQNPYYMGLVSYKGIHYEGKHEPLAEPDVWLAVQDILAAHNHQGEKDRKHTHYLRSTIYCSNCGGRMVYSEHTGNGGTYVYFVCVKRRTKTNNCRRSAVRLERIEHGIADFYARFRLSRERVEQIMTGVRTELATQQREAQRGLIRATKRKQALTDERQKLLQAHYAGAIPTDLLGAEMKRLTREMAAADTNIAEAKTTTTDLEAVLDAALAAAANCQTAYLSAPEPVRRQINQGFFKRLLIGEDGTVEEAELTEPFAALLAEGGTIRAGAEVAVADIADASTPDGIILASQTVARPLALAGAYGAALERDRSSGAFWATFDDDTGITDSEESVTHRDTIFPANGVNEDYLVGAAGFEPATARV